MLSKYFNYLLFVFCFPLFQYTVKAQNLNQDIQIDTVRVSESTIFIMNIEGVKIDLKYGGYSITTIKIHDFINDSLIQTIIDTSLYLCCPGRVKYIDINLDGYLDLDVGFGVYNLVPYHSFWLFDKLNNKFYYSPEFSRLNEYDIDVEKKEIESFSQSLGGRGGYLEKYKIVNGNLSLLETEESYKYDCVHREVVNGKLRTV